MSLRGYSEPERHALRVAFQQPATRGPAEFACGPYWPDELERRAREYERLIPTLRLAANALRREIEADPRCASSPSVLLHDKEHSE